jgi:hypothetical protein
LKTVAENIEIARNSPLQTLRVTWDAPMLLTSSGAMEPIEDFARLYRMSTGIYGQGYPGMENPFPYAKPYISELHFGSDLYVQVVLPTEFIVGVAGLGLPNLLSLLKEALILPADVATKLGEKRTIRAAAKRERLELESEFEDAGKEARAKQKARIANAENRELQEKVAMAETLVSLDPETRPLVQELYGSAGDSALVRITERAARGPARPRNVVVGPAEKPELYPSPPEHIPPPRR